MAISRAAILNPRGTVCLIRTLRPLIRTLVPLSITLVAVQTLSFASRNRIRPSFLLALSSEDSMLLKGRGTCRSGLYLPANNLLSARLLTRPGHCFFLNQSRNNQNTIHVAENQITRLDAN